MICASRALRDGGPGVRFPVHPGGEQGAFVVRFRGKTCAYVNRCPHAGTELDWQPGAFFEEAGLYLICSTHGALFEPDTGRCIAGPCEGQRLEPIGIEENDGHVIIACDPIAEEASSPNAP